MVELRCVGFAGVAMQIAGEVDLVRLGFVDQVARGGNSCSYIIDKSGARIACELASPPWTVQLTHALFVLVLCQWHMYFWGAELREPVARQFEIDPDELRYVAET